MYFLVKYQLKRETLLKLVPRRDF